MARVYTGFDDYGIRGVDEEFVHFVFDIVISMVELSSDLEAGLVVTDDKRMCELNKQYRDKDEPTNILSFVYGETKDKFFEGDEKNYLGDIYISRSRIESQARQARVSDRDEFVRLFVHGLLHLAGIHHKNEAEAVKMEAMEDKIIAEICST